MNIEPIDNRVIDYINEEHMSYKDKRDKVVEAAQFYLGYCILYTHFNIKEIEELKDYADEDMLITTSNEQLKEIFKRTQNYIKVLTESIGSGDKYIYTFQDKEVAEIGMYATGNNYFLQMKKLFKITVRSDV